MTVSSCDSCTLYRQVASTACAANASQGTSFHLMSSLNLVELAYNMWDVVNIVILKIAPYCPLLLRILTFPDPHCQPGQIFVVQNGVYMCPAYSTTCFNFNQHLRGLFQAPKIDFDKNCHFWLFLPEVNSPLGCHLGNIKTYTGQYRPLYLCIRLTQEGF